MTFHMQNFGGKLPSRVNEINTLIILLSTVIHVYFSSFETYKYCNCNYRQFESCFAIVWPGCCLITLL